MLNIARAWSIGDETPFHEDSKRREDHEGSHVQEFIVTFVMLRDFVMNRCSAVLIALAAAFLSTNTPHAQAAKRLALVGGMLVTGYDVPPIHHAAVLIEGD